MVDNASVMDTFARGAVDAEPRKPVQLLEILTDPAVVRIAWLAAGISALSVTIAGVL